MRSLILFLAVTVAVPAIAQTLEQQLLDQDANNLAKAARAEGDAKRGALLFFQAHLACSKCHSTNLKTESIVLGPNLVKPATQDSAKLSDVELVESVLEPSKSIRPEYQSVTIVTDDGQVITGQVTKKDEHQVVVRDLQDLNKLRSIRVEQIESSKPNAVSIMPAGQVNQLNSRQQFLDLVKYLMEIRDGGAERAAQLQPPPSMLTVKIPEYEQNLDHANLIGSWNDESFERGKAIYARVCANCHGTHDQPGSLPTSLRFAEGKFKNGNDPLSMYRTITYGFGLMTPQTWMVPSQKYDVIHYIREAYMKRSSENQYVLVADDYLARLPKGNTTGPAPSEIETWSAMDYGPTLTHTYEIPGPKSNLAHKGVAVRLDSGPGGVSRGRHWLIFDTDTLRVSAAWNGTGAAKNNFIDWQGIQFNGTHGVHPRIIGQVAFANSTGPGWANPSDNSFQDDQRVLGRDGNQYGPLPKSWGKFEGIYHFNDQAIFKYSVGNTKLVESPRLIQRDGEPLVARTFNIGPRDRDLVLQVAEHLSDEAAISAIDPATVLFSTQVDQQQQTSSHEVLAFDGNTFLEAESKAFDFNAADFSILARLRTTQNGTIVAVTSTKDKWTPNGQTFFIRDGKLGFDIGWVGAVTGKARVNDGKWHDVAVTWEQSNQSLRLYVDGKLDGKGKLDAKDRLEESVVRIGFTSPDFPKPASFFEGELAEVEFVQALLAQPEQLKCGSEKATKPTAHWKLKGAKGAEVVDQVNQLVAKVQHGGAAVTSQRGVIVAGFAPADAPLEWLADKSNLRLKIRAGEKPLRFTVWLPTDGATVEFSQTADYAARFANQAISEPDKDLSEFVRGAAARWPQKIETQVEFGAEDGPFAADILTPPENNPWLAQTRFTGLDFFADGRIAVCTWDGDVWITELAPSVDNYQATDVRPLKQTAKWQRIASGMFQPLGLKIVKEQIYVICRDQLTILRDLNGDGETDYYECFNHDHQVTPHFHEFAMGLQTDAEGNFYYAKSGQHGLAAVVPHHGTLLKISRDGSKTDILANGFRAANGVCLNPDGSFVVTDQEGFWNPKNRINWVTLDPSGKPKFYGNMLGYHDVTDESDSAMEPPLCWITNAFDRSPGELLWVDSPRWKKLNGSLLNLSYGYGKVFLVPHEKVAGQMQGGMIELPIPNFPTGAMRGRFHPQDQQLYLCGMFAWAGNATYPGGLYRLRATGRAMNLPQELHALKDTLKLNFTEPIDASKLKPNDFQVTSWSLKRTANYGSKHHDEQQLKVTQATVSPDGLIVTLTIPELKPTWCMEIKYSLHAKDGTSFEGTIHNTIHNLSR